MDYNGRKIGFKRSVGAITDLAQLAPGGQIDRLGEVFDGSNLATTAETGAKLLAILNKWYERSLAFSEPGYKPDPIPEEWFMLLDIDVYAELLDEAMKQFEIDDKPTIEAVEPKGKKNE